MCCVVYDFFTLKNLSQFAQIIISIGTIFSIWQIIKNKKKDEAMLNTIEKQKQFYEMQIAEKEKQQKEKEERERFEKMLKFVFYSHLNGNNEAIAILDNIFLDEKTNLRDLVKDKFEFKCGIRYNYGYGSPEKQEKGFYENLLLFSFNQNHEKYIDILRRELPKILTPDVFDGEKLIVKDE